MTSILLFSSSVWAQAGSAEQASPCVAVPIFHCVQYLDGGGASAHFGYDLQCRDGAGAAAEIFIDINEDNLFSPGRRDRGQPKVFLSGEHIDEFEADFSAAEVKSGSDFNWSVLDQTATVDFTRSKDASLDCSILPQ
jgi:hypothetical protein